MPQISVAQAINQVKDPATQQALYILFEQLRSDIAANVATFNAHTHKTPTTNPGFTTTPGNDAAGAGASGQTATSHVSNWQK